MSHFVTAVFVPTNIATDAALLDSYLNKVLGPYDENFEVDEYDRDCHCIGEVARSEARQRTEDKFGTWDDMRSNFNALILADGRNVGEMRAREHQLACLRKLTLEEEKEYKEIDKECDSLWKDYIKERNEFEEKLFNEHPMKDEPNPKCGFYSGERADWWPEDAKEGDRYDDESGCGGTGTYRSTYNPQSKWDWWVIGGRWNGWLAPPELKPENQPENYQKCFVCQGTGLRNDKLGLEARANNPEYTCNGCNGDGKTLKWTTDLRDTGYNVVTPEYILSLGLLGELPTPFAFIDTDGEWHEKGKMGWFGISSDEKERIAWVKEWSEALNSLNSELFDYRVVVTDLHI